MTQNNSVQVYRGGWPELQYAKFTDFHLSTGTDPRDIMWKPDGGLMIIAERSLNKLLQFFPSVDDWSINSMVEGTPFDLTGIENQVNGLWVRPDGLRCYIIGAENKKVIQLNTIFGWRIDLLTDPVISFPPTEDIGNPLSLYMRADGLKYYISGDTDDKIWEYNMTIPWDITTSVFIQSLSVTVNVSAPHSVFFKPDGLMMYVASNTENAIVRYILSVPWDISTAIFEDFLDVAPQDTSPFGLFIRQNDGKKLYMAGNEENRIYDYDMNPSRNNSIITQLGAEITTEDGANLVTV